MFTSYLWKGIYSLWQEERLSEEFWQYGNNNRIPVLWDTEATPGQPYPYCVIESLSYSVKERMSDNVYGKYREVRDYILRFHIYTSSIGNKSAKEIGAELARKVMNVFGGGEKPPKKIPLEKGKHISTDLELETVSRESEDVSDYILEYRIRVDLPLCLCT